MSEMMKFLREHRNGVTIDDLGDALQTLNEAVATEEKGGSLTITISVSPMSKTSGAYEVKVAHSLSLPKKPAGSSIFYLSPENTLVRDDPRQTKMELRDIGPAAPIRGLA